MAYLARSAGSRSWGAPAPGWEPDMSSFPPSPKPPRSPMAPREWIKRRPLVVLLGVVAFAGVVGNFIKPPPPAPPAPPPPPPPDERIPGPVPGSIVAPMIGPVLKDPDSARYQDVTIRKRMGSVVFCGEVNSKNSFGGYVGWRSFIITAGGFIQSGVEIQTEENQRRFATTWNLLCYKTDLDDKPSVPKKVKLHGHP